MVFSTYKKIVFGIILISVMAMIFHYAFTTNKKLVCRDFKFQKDAQKAYDNGATYLDGDKDHIACESLPFK